MRWLRHWLGLHIRSDWHWQHESTHPALVLQRPPQPGWYMLTVTLKAEQQRCYGVFNGTQSRLLISNRRRRRLVRVARREARFALLGVNGCVAIEELRLVRQPFWRVKRLLRGKLLALHPAYPASTMPSQPLNKLWCDYNRLVGRRVHALVGYDAWIEQVERPSLHGDEPSDTPTLSFAIWLHGDRSEHDACERSIASLEGQLRGDYRLLDRDQQLEGGDLQCWVVLLRVGDVLASQALQRLAMVIGAHSEVAVVYSDEDRISQTGRRHSPQFKPAWNPDLLYSDPHYSNSWCLRSDVCLTACESLQADVQQAELYSLVLEATHLVKAEQIVHLPEVLYHHADADDGARGSAASVATLQRFLERHQQRADAIVRPGGGHVLHWPLPAEAPCVSVIIPTRDQGKMLRRCIESLTSHIDDRLEVEIIIMDNDSQEDETLAYLAHLKTLPNFQVHRCPGEFNYAAINNQGVGLARGDLIAFINNDIEAIHHGWLSTMVAHACRLEVGAVGARLLYADGTVQHGGVV
ncbi:MAG: glycosyltransferase, partial [Actinobacteria bacterium]|nr:glycosyltransferase [Actinomycetota bacterium]